MNEILTCEEYVLNELRIAKEELSLVKKEIEELKFEKETLLNQINEGNKLDDKVRIKSEGSRYDKVNIETLQRK